MNKRILYVSLVSAAAILALTGSAATTSPPTEAGTLQQQPSRIPTAGPECLVPDEQRPGLDRVSCDKFETRLRISKVEGDQVWIRYALGNVKCNGYYVVHFWPNGRHNQPVEAFHIGDLKVGQGKNGEFGPYKVPGVTSKKTFRYNLDFDIFANRGAVRNPLRGLNPAAMKTTFIGQCDSGGTFTVDPPTTTTRRPPTPDPCACRVFFIEDRACERPPAECGPGVKPRPGEQDYVGQCTGKFPRCTR